MIPSDNLSSRFYWERSRDFLRHYFGGLYERVGENHIFLFGGGLAFSLITCIVPFVLIVIYLLGHLLESQAVNQQLDLFIDTMIPYLKYSNAVKRILHSRADEVIAYKEIAGYIGGVGLFFAASGLFSGMRTSLDRIFITGGPKRVYMGKLKDVGMVLLVIVFVILSTAIFPTLEVLKDSAEKITVLNVFRLGDIQRKLFFVGSFATIFILFFVLYTLIPHKRLGLKIPALGAFWAAVMWAAAKEIFGYYITNFASLKRIYGTYMLFAVITFWIYYSSVIFLVGAQIAQLYRERRDHLERERAIRLR